MTIDVEFFYDDVLHLHTAGVTQDTKCGRITYRTSRIKGLLAMNGVYVFETGYVTPCVPEDAKRWLNKDQSFFTALEYDFMQFDSPTCSQTCTTCCLNDDTSKQGEVRVVYAGNFLTIRVLPISFTFANLAYTNPVYFQTLLDLSCPLSEFPIVINADLVKGSSFTDVRCSTDFPLTFGPLVVGAVEIVVGGF